MKCMLMAFFNVCLSVCLPVRHLLPQLFYIVPRICRLAVFAYFKMKMILLFKFEQRRLSHLADDGSFLDDLTKLYQPFPGKIAVNGYHTVLSLIHI